MDTFQFALSTRSRFRTKALEDEKVDICLHNTHKLINKIEQSPIMKLT